MLVILDFHMTSNQILLVLRYTYLNLKLESASGPPIQDKCRYPSKPFVLKILQDCTISHVRCFTSSPQVNWEKSFAHSLIRWILSMLKSCVWKNQSKFNSRWLNSYIRGEICAQDIWSHPGLQCYLSL